MEFMGGDFSRAWNMFFQKCLWEHYLPLSCLVQDFVTLRGTKHICLFHACSWLCYTFSNKTYFPFSCLVPDFFTLCVPWKGNIFNFFMLLQGAIFTGVSTPSMHCIDNQNTDKNLWLYHKVSIMLNHRIRNFHYIEVYNAWKFPYQPYRPLYQGALYRGLTVLYYWSCH